jgi:hypothetical protein
MIDAFTSNTSAHLGRMLHTAVGDRRGIRQIGNHPRSNLWWLRNETGSAAESTERASFSAVQHRATSQFGRSAKPMGFHGAHAQCLTWGGMMFPATKRGRPIAVHGTL